MRKMLSLLLTVLMFISIVPFASAAETEYNYTISTEFYGYDSAEDDWVPVTTASGGDTVKMRVSVSTNFVSGSATLMLAYDKSVLSADLPSTGSSTRLTLNIEKSSFAYNKVQFVNGAHGTGAANNQMAAGNLTTEEYEKYSFIVCSIFTNGCVQYVGTDWIFEVDMTVLNGSKGKSFECFVIPGTVQTVNNKKGVVSFPYAPAESTDLSTLTSAFNWYDGMPVVEASSVSVVADNITGDVYPDGYSFEDDRYSFRNEETEISADVYTDIYGDAKGNAIYGSTDGTSDVSYGMAYTTGLFLSGNADTADFDAENIKDITKDSAADFIAQSEAGFYAAELSSGNCEDIFNAVYDYVYNGGAPVVITMKTYSFSDGKRNGAEVHSVLAAGLSSNNEILIDDPDFDSVQKLTFAVDSDGAFTNEWSYSGSSGLYGDNTYDEQEGHAGIICFSLAEPAAVENDKNLVCVDGNGATVTGAEKSAADNYYWADGDSAVEVSSAGSGTVSVSSENATVSTQFGEGQNVTVLHSDSETTVEQILGKDEICDVTFEVKNSGGETIGVHISGSSTGDTVKIVRNGSTITVEGLYEFSVSAENEDNNSVRKNFESENGGLKEVYFDLDSLVITGKLYSVEWIVDGVTELTSEYEEGDAITEKPEPEKYGYTLAGWSPDVPDRMPAESLVFTAVWQINTHTVTFDADGGEFSDGGASLDVPTEYSAEIIATETPARQGYVFAGWASAQGGEAMATLGKMDDEGDKIFYALWIAADDVAYTVETYTMLADGTYSVTSTGHSGTTDETVTAAVSVPEGFSLNGGKSVITGTVAPDGSLVLKVYYDRKTYKFITVVNGESATTEYLYGASVAAPATPSVQGYTFKGWSSDVPVTMPCNDVTLTARFTAAATVKIKNNPGSKTINYGETLRLTAETANMPAGAYVKWYVEGSGVSMSQESDGSTCDITSTGSGTVTVTAKVVDKNGNPISNESGEISDSQKVTSNAGIWQKIVSFFKNLFRANRTIIQAFKAL